MTLIPIQVESYSGSKADETPRRFVWEGRVIEVQEVVDRWYQVESLPEWPRADYFKVLSEDGSQYLLKHDLESDEWYLGKKR
jgi:hypothetical protein